MNLTIDSAHEHFKNMSHSKDTSRNDFNFEALETQNMAENDEIYGPISLKKSKRLLAFKKQQQLQRIRYDLK